MCFFRRAIINMKTNTQPLNSKNEYITAFRGSFVSLLRWPQLDSFWQTLKQQADGNWYVYTVGQTVPTVTVTAEELIAFIDKIDQQLRQEHQEDFCGIVYVDNKEKPDFIKIYDPNNLGVSCGYSDNPPLPGWVLSKIKPVDLFTNLTKAETPKHWWQRWFK